MPTRRPRALALLLLAVALLLPGTAAPALAQPELTGLGIRLMDAPTARKDDPRASTFIIDHVAPGASFSRRVEVFNDTGAAAQIKVYVAPAGVEDSGFSIGPSGARSELTDWMSTDTELLSLEQGQSQVVTVAVAVPSDASPGERYAAVVAELPPGDDPGQVKIATRVGIRTYLSVGPGGEPASDFVIESVEPARTEAGLPQISAIVTNTGGRALDLTGELRLTEGPGGLSAGPFPAELGTTLGPGESGPVLIALDQSFPDGPWRAELRLVSGLLERAATAVITFPEPGETGRAVEATPLTEDWSFLVPLAIGLIVLAALMLLWLLWRRRRKDEREDEPVEVGPVPAPRRTDDEVVRR